MCSLFLHYLNDSIEKFNQSNINNVKTHQKALKILELRPLWYIENNDVIFSENQNDIDKMFYKCLNKGSKVKIK